MNLDDLKQIQAKVKSATKPEEITEAVASLTLFADEIAKASEKYVQDAKDAVAAKAEAEKTSAAFKIELAEAKKTLQELRDAQAASAAEAKFNERMTAVAEHFNLDDEVRAFVVEDVRACSDDASFDKCFAKMKKTMKGLVKAGSQDVNSQDKTPAADSGTQGVQSKDGADTVHSVPGNANAATKDKKAADDKDEDDACKAAAATAVASAKANPVDKQDIDVIGNVAASVTIEEQMRQAFAQNTTIGGRKVAEIIDSKKKK